MYTINGRYDTNVMMLWLWHYDIYVMILFSIKTIPLLRPLGLSPQGGRYRGILLYSVSINR